MELKWITLILVLVLSDTRRVMERGQIQLYKYWEANTSQYTNNKSMEQSTHLGVWPNVSGLDAVATNANTLHISGVHWYNYANPTTELNYPENNYGCSLLTIFKNNSVGFQICYMYSRKLYYRGLWSADENAWSTWKEL